MKHSCEIVLALLRSRGPLGLTALEALENGGGFRLSGRILELRQAGFDIDTSWETGSHGVRYARYTLHEKPTQLDAGLVA